MRILLVDDDQSSRQSIAWFLKRQNHEVTECANAEHALMQIAAHDFPLVLSDIYMPGMTGHELTAAIKALPDSWRTDIVLFSGQANLKSAIMALRGGVYDYLEKPVDVEELSAVVERSAEHQSLLRENHLLTKKFDDAVEVATEETRRDYSRMNQAASQAFVGQAGIFSEAMHRLWDLAHKFHTDRTIPVLIEGETGVGKEVFARAIHLGPHGDTTTAGVFVDINCAAITAGLFESELFGYEAGSYTGSSSKGQKGKLDLAKGGTLFLDEVGELPPALQGKLLRVLQEREYYRVGGLKKIKLDARIICATNQPLAECVEKGLFRRDLYFRLKVGHLVIPPLRERREEIAPIAALFLHDFARKKRKPVKTIPPEALRVLEAYDWPGNIRELKNVMELAVFASVGEEIGVKQFCALCPQGQSPVFSTSTDEGVQTEGLVLPFPAQGHSLKQYVDDIIKKVLAAHGDNQTLTAKYLGISRRALSYRLENKHGDLEEF